MSTHSEAISEEILRAEARRVTRLESLREAMRLTGFPTLADREALGLTRTPNPGEREALKPLLAQRAAQEKKEAQAKKEAQGGKEPQQQNEAQEKAAQHLREARQRADLEHLAQTIEEESRQASRAPISAAEKETDDLRKLLEREARVQEWLVKLPPSPPSPNADSRPNTADSAASSSSTSLAPIRSSIAQPPVVRVRPSAPMPAAGVIADAQEQAVCTAPQIPQPRYSPYAPDIDDFILDTTSPWLPCLVPRPDDYPLGPRFRTPRCVKGCCPSYRTIKHQIQNELEELQEFEIDLWDAIISISASARQGPSPLVTAIQRTRDGINSKPCIYKSRHEVVGRFEQEAEIATWLCQENDGGVGEEETELMRRFMTCELYIIQNVKFGEEFGLEMGEWRERWLDPESLPLCLAERRGGGFF